MTDRLDTDPPGNGAVPRQPAPGEKTAPFREVLFAQSSNGEKPTVHEVAELVASLIGEGGGGGGGGDDLSRIGKRHSRQLLAAVVAIIIAVVGAWRAMERSLHEATANGKHLKERHERHENIVGHPGMVKKVDAVDDKVDDIAAEQRVQHQALDYIKEGIDDITAEQQRARRGRR